MPHHVRRATFRVVMSEVDVAQIHFTAVHRWMDRGLSEWLAEVGHPFTRLLEEGPGIPIVEHMTGLDALPLQGFRFWAVPPKVAGMGTFPVRAYAELAGES